MTTPVEAAAQNLRTLLAEIEAGELECSPTYRRCLEGAVIALEAVAEPDSDTPSTR